MIIISFCDISCRYHDGKAKSPLKSHSWVLEKSPEVTQRALLAESETLFPTLLFFQQNTAIIPSVHLNHTQILEMHLHQSEQRQGQHLK